jgi:hypothetical protein
MLCAFASRRTFLKLHLGIPAKSFHILGMIEGFFKAILKLAAR